MSNASSLKSKTAKGLLWGTLSNGAQQVLTLVFGIWLARMLSTADYGMVGQLTIHHSGERIYGSFGESSHD